jgi:hypothetical protein
MNGYVDTGYVVAIGTLCSYGVSLLIRERSARLRLGAIARDGEASEGAMSGQLAGPDDAASPL